MKEMSDKTKETIATGASAAAGAAIGVAAGSAFAAHAAEPHRDLDNDEPIVPDGEIQDQPAEPAHAPAHHSEPAPAVDPDPKPNQAGTNEITPEPTPVHDPSVTVLTYDTVDDMDLAVVDVDGMEIGVLDIDRDGFSDVLMADINNDGIIQDDEMYICGPGEQISMQELEINAQGSIYDAPSYGDDLAYGSDTDDYVNDANVDDYTI